MQPKPVQPNPLSKPKPVKSNHQSKTPSRGNIESVLGGYFLASNPNKLPYPIIAELGRQNPTHPDLLPRVVITGGRQVNDLKLPKEAFLEALKKPSITARLEKLAADLIVACRQMPAGERPYKLPEELPWLHPDKPGYNSRHPRFVLADSIKLAPYSKVHLYSLAGDHSALINRQVLTVEDAIDHTMALVALWHQEELELMALQERIDKRSAQKRIMADGLVEGTPAYEIEEARVAWKAAVAKRQQTICELDAEVHAAHSFYKTKKLEYRKNSKGKR